MNLVTILPLILIVGVMLMMTRSAKSKQRQAAEMRNQMEPGAGVRTIGGMYAVVKEVNDETVLLELTDGVHAHFAKNAIGTVLSEGEFNRIVHGIEPEDVDLETAEGAEAAEPVDVTKTGLPGAADSVVAGDVVAPEKVSVPDDARPNLQKKDADDHGPADPDKAGEVLVQDDSSAGSK
ncbi:preprotein translocase subunit YajC [Streptomyces sp. NBC_01190]|uniref:preprotein translocase subunit YajC n=1 Tax=Streptomyces sp. NBC_01190 TaxID=2903767 RepID=UPI00386A2955|nr:preprotein translocase subunit YajC [Streptomyces sp. NBC_01190]